MRFDIAKYAALLLKVYQLEEQLRKNPPNGVEEYTQAVMDIKALWEEIHAMVKAGKPTPGDIEAAHLRNQQAWTVKEEPAADPTSVVYTTKESAIAALGGEFVYVLEMEDGTFRIWPVLGPFPGRQVWPE